MMRSRKVSLKQRMALARPLCYRHARIVVVADEQRITRLEMATCLQPVTVLSDLPALSVQAMKPNRSEGVQYCGVFN